MARVRVSTTVDDSLLARARAVHGDGTDASLVEAALEAMLREHRSAEIDEAYARGYAEAQARGGRLVLILVVEAMRHAGHGAAFADDLARAEAEVTSAER